MNRKEWQALLDSYSSVEETARESLTGVRDHLETKCNKGHTFTATTLGADRRNLPPFHVEPMVCDRGTRGCNLEHRDREALVFARMTLERINTLIEEVQ